MSAYIISERNINRIVNSAAKYRQSVAISGEVLSLNDTHDLKRIGQILTDENYRSVNYRYNEHDETPKYKYSYTSDWFSPIELLKALDCLEYQSCEYPDWKESLALRIIEQVRRVTTSILPGYEEAEWLG